MRGMKKMRRKKNDKTNVFKMADKESKPNRTVNTSISLYCNSTGGNKMTREERKNYMYRPRQIIKGAK